MVDLESPKVEVDVILPTITQTPALMLRYLRRANERQLAIIRDLERIKAAIDAIEVELSGP